MVSSALDLIMHSSPENPAKSVSLDPPAPPRGLWGFLLDFHNKTILFRIGDWIVVTYGLLAAFAFMVGFSAGIWFDAMTGQNIALKTRFYLFFFMPAVLMGCRAFSILLEWRELFRRPLQTLVKPGYMFHGGFFAALAALYGYSHFSGVNYWLLLDAGAFAVPLGEALCRLGCYVYGCCWGRPTSGRVGVRYTSPHAKVVRCAPHLHGVKLHPAQVYALVAHLLQFAVLYVLLPYRTFDGMITLLFLITHPIIRFTMEYYRQDDRGTIGTFTHSNLYSAIMIMIGVVGLFILGGGNAPLTPIDMSIRYVHVITDPSVFGWLAGIGAVCFLAYGVHFKKVGSWLTSLSGGVGPNVDEMSMGAAERLERVMQGKSAESSSHDRDDH